jgi:4-hydroxybenzoate polyprenyltransferase
MFRRVALLLDSIKFAHSVFALPFALLAMIVAAGGWPPWRVVLLILVCMVSARSAAMAFNRWHDRELDAANPLTLVAVCVFMAAAWFLNTACFAGAPLALAVLLGYSFSKRFTNLSHFWLGLALGLAPLGAHLAVRGDLAPLPGLGARWGLGFELFPFLLLLAVLLWTAGFDLIYACQDYDFDLREPALHSMPKSLGVRGALILSGVLHFFAAALLFAAGIYAGLGPGYMLAVSACAALLVYEHWIVRPGDLSRVNTAFFTVNGAVSLLLFVAVFVERVLLAR